MKSTEYYSQPGIPCQYYNWLANGCSTSDEIVDLIKGYDANISYPGGLLVDLGCGPGTSFAQVANSLNIKKIHLVDAVSDMISLAKDMIVPDFSITAQVCDLSTDRVELSDECADIVVASCLLMYFEDTSHLLAEASRLLKAGGLLGYNAIFHLNKEDRGPVPFKDDLDIDCYAHSTDIIAALNGRFEHVNSYKVRDMTVEGRHSMLITSLFKKN